MAPNSPLFLINVMSGSQYCHYGFQIDTYKDGCTHDCTYCYAREEGLRENRWNNPAPVPIDIEGVRTLFHTVFETDRPSPWRAILEKRIPLRLGGYTDCFMKLDKKHQVTLALLGILKEYRYPHVIVTRSTLVASEPYLSAMDPTLAVPQVSIPSLNDELTRLMEPTATRVRLRLDTLETLAKAGFRVAVRINPLFPIYPDGYYTDTSFDHDRAVPTFDYFSYELIDAVAERGAKNLIVGFVHLSPTAFPEVREKMLAGGVDLQSFLAPSAQPEQRGFAYGGAEIRAYYEKIGARCLDRKMRFTTCYLGMGDFHYETHRDLWSNQGDCCDIKGILPGFEKTTLDISMRDMVRASSAEGGGWLKQTTQLVGLRVFNYMAKKLVVIPDRPGDRPDANPAQTRPK